MANYDHIFLSGFRERNDFVSPRSGRPKVRLPEREQFGHAAVLKHQWKAVWARLNEESGSQETEEVDELDPEKGEYIDFYKRTWLWVELQEP